MCALPLFQALFSNNKLAILDLEHVNALDHFFVLVEMHIIAGNTREVTQLGDFRTQGRSIGSDLGAGIQNDVDCIKGTCCKAVRDLVVLCRIAIHKGLHGIIQLCGFQNRGKECGNSWHWQGFLTVWQEKRKTQPAANGL